MGTVYRLNCKKCGYKFDAHLGSSGFFPISYEVILNNVLNGKYGEEIQKLVREKQVELMHFVSGTRILIKCRDCGHFEVVPKLIISKKNDPSVEYQHKCKNFDDVFDSYKNFDDFLASLQDNNDSVEYQHKCKICGGEVENFDEIALDKNFGHYFDFLRDEKFKRNQDNIKFECPNCHEELVVMSVGTWD